VSDDTAVVFLYNSVKMYYVYFLFMNNGQIYTGSSGNLRQRIVQHEKGLVATTSKYLPVSLVGYESYLEKSDAQRRERFMKTTEGKRLFRQQYRDAIAKHMRV
jgi:putative endonuclease